MTGFDVTSGSIYVGCQGWRYADWRAVAPCPDATPFYRANTPATHELACYSRTFDLVEVDSTFYAVPQARTLEGWAAQTPQDFRFTLKLPRALTHEARLRRGRGTLLEFCKRSELLGPKLAAILIQLPPSFGTDELPALERFLPHLPAGLPFAVEFRDPGWLNWRTLELLCRHQVALTLGETPWIDTATSLPWLEHLPVDWVYVRIMGAKQGGLERFTHLQVNRDRELSEWAAALKQLALEGRNACVLLDNHFQGFSPGSASLLKRKLGQPIHPFPRDSIHSGGQLGLDLDVVPSREDATM
ncbi:MAG: DUF72 domain-containing protein [Gemmatimonadaceae bacterium]|nr:DUF72 domain-containing protein [Gloeobacterales cyanobacterium ES-bin-141]